MTAPQEPAPPPGPFPAGPGVPPTAPSYPPPPQLRSGRGTGWPWLLAAGALVVGLVAGAGLGYALAGSGGEARQDAAAACATLDRWDGVEALESDPLRGSWPAFAVFGHAMAAAEHDDRYEGLAEASQDMFRAIQRGNVEAAGDGIEAISQECGDLGF